MSVGCFFVRENDFKSDFVPPGIVLFKLDKAVLLSVQIGNIAGQAASTTFSIRLSHLLVEIVTLFYENKNSHQKRSSEEVGKWFPKYRFMQ